MSLSEAEIERVVQEVLRRLAAMNVLPVKATTPRTTLSLVSRLITVAELKDRTQGITRVEVPLRAVVTPAAKDYLRERGIQLVKSCESAKS